MRSNLVDDDDDDDEEELLPSQTKAPQQHTMAVMAGISSTYYLQMQSTKLLYCPNFN